MGLIGAVVCSGGREVRQLLCQPNAMVVGRNSLCAKTAAAPTSQQGVSKY